MRRTYTGACHCGAVRYEAVLDLEEQGTARCNCTYCAKGRSWTAGGDPTDLTVTEGEDRLVRYAARPGARHSHDFCGTCGIHVVSRGEVEGMGPFMTVQVATLDEAPEVLRDAAIAWQDGRADDWTSPPADTRGL